MRLQTRLSLGICTGMALAAAACFGLTLWSADRLLDDNVRSRLAAVETEVDASIDAESRRASSMARLIAALPPVVDAFAARDREALAAIVLPAFPAVRDDGVGQFQFHTPPATSFLRVHSPAQFGDDLSSLRSTVVETNRSHQSVRGVEVGQFGLGIRGVEPVSSSGRHIGSVEFGLSLDAAFVAAYTERTGTMLALHLGENGQGTVLASSFPEGFAFDAADIAQGFSGPFLVKSVRVGATRRAALMYPLLDYSGTPVGVVTVAIDRTELDAMSQQIITVFGGLAVAIVLSGLGLAWLLNRGIAGPLVSFTASLQELGAGKQNVRIFGVGRRDEIGELAAAVQGIQQNAVDKAEADRLADERRNSQARLERANLMSRLAGDFEAAVGSIVTGVASASKEMEQAARALSSSSQQTSAKASTVSTASEQASANVQTVAAAAEELSASVNAINDQVTRSTSMSQQARSQAQQTVTKVSDMAANAEKIGDIISLIRRIADQTNLLALNATIEAARAGEAGKGFAVVADEVKLLADQTATATTEIASQIGQIQTSTSESADAIRHIASVIEELSEATTIIAAGIDEQGAATREIARNVHLASGATVKVNNAIGDVMQEASGSSAAASQVLASASGLSHQSDRLSAAVASFVAAVLSDADGAQDITGRRAAA